jgi:hypothetical protein
VRIVQRLNGMNWVHRLEKTTLSFFLRAEINNRILAFIRRHLADDIVYQSNFSRDWWERVWKTSPFPHQVTYNGVDLEQFSPQWTRNPPTDHFRILLVEGHLDWRLCPGPDMAIKLAKPSN